MNGQEFKCIQNRENLQPFTPLLTPVLNYVITQGRGDASYEFPCRVSL